MFTFRATSSDDLPALTELLKLVWNADAGAVAYHGGGRVPGTAALKTVALKTVALKDGQIVGYASAQRKALHTRHTYIGVHVRPNGRGRGIGAALWGEVTANVSGSLKTALYGDDPIARYFLERRGLRVSVETYQPTLDLAQLDHRVLERWKDEAEKLGYELLPMTELDGPELWRDVARLHAEVYAHSHQHDPPDPVALERVDFLDDDFSSGWLWLARKEGKLAGVSSILRADDAAQGELGYFGVPAAFAEDGKLLTLALTAAALQAAEQEGVVGVDAELDSADPNALALWQSLPWQHGRIWLTLTSCESG